MATTVTVSRTVLPIPVDPRDTENPIFDEQGVPLIGGPFQVILDAINALHRKIDRMSATLQSQMDAALQAEQAMLTTLMDNVTAIQADLAKVIGELTPGTPVTQAQIDTLVANNVTLGNIVTASAPPASVP